MMARELEASIHKEVVNQIVIATPEWWDRASLTLIQTSCNGIDSCDHEISNPDYPKDLVVATDELILATRSLALLYKKAGNPWSKVVYEIWQQPDGNWVFKTVFTYE